MNKDRVVKKISVLVCEKFPEFAGVKPNVKWNVQPTPNGVACILTFQATVQTGNGKKMTRRVKVNSNAAGEILKISDSK